MRENRQRLPMCRSRRESIDRGELASTHRPMPVRVRAPTQVRPRKRWAWAQATATSRGGASRRLIGINSPEAETIAVSSRRQRVQTKRTSCGDADQLDRFTLAAIGQASQCEHDTRNRPGSSIPIPSDSASCPPPSMANPSKSFRCPGTANSCPERAILGALFPGVRRHQASSAMAAHAADLVDFAFDDFEGGWTMAPEMARLRSRQGRGALSVRP